MSLRTCSEVAITAGTNSGYSRSSSKPVCTNSSELAADRAQEAMTYVGHVDTVAVLA